MERGCYEKLLWRVWSLWKLALKKNNDDDGNVGNKILLGCALWILDKLLQWFTLFPLMKDVGNVFIPSSIHRPVNAFLPNNLLKQRFAWADTCLNIHKCTYKCCQKERNILLTWFSQNILPNEWKVRTREYLAALESTLPRFCRYAILKWNG